MIIETPMVLLGVLLVCGKLVLQRAFLWGPFSMKQISIDLAMGQFYFSIALRSCLEPELGDENFSRRS